MKASANSQYLSFPPDARWFTREEVLTVLHHATGSYLDLAKLAEASSQLNNDPNEPPFRVPPTTAVAGVLIKDWAEGVVKFPPFSLTAPPKGNL